MTKELEVCIIALHMLAQMRHWGSITKQQGKFICEWKGGSTPQAIAALALHELGHMGVPVPHPTQSLEEFLNGKLNAADVAVSTLAEHPDNPANG